MTAMTKHDLRLWRIRLTSIRGREAVSQAEAAERLGVSRHTYLDWETGKTGIPGTVPLACAAISNGLEPIGESVT